MEIHFRMPKCKVIMRWQKLAHATEFNPLPIIIIPRFLLHGAVYGLQVQAIRVSLHGGGGGGGGA